MYALNYVGFSEQNLLLLIQGCICRRNLMFSGLLSEGVSQQPSSYLQVQITTFTHFFTDLYFNFFLYWIPVYSFYWGCLYVDSPLWFVICHPCVSGSIELDEVSHQVEIIQSLLVYVAFVLIYFSISLKRFVSAMCHGWMPQLLSARMAYFLYHTCVIWFNGVAWSWTSSIIWLHCAYCSCWNCLLSMKTQIVNLMVF